MTTDVPASIEQTDGRISMTVSKDMALRVDHPRNQPLAAIESHATIVVTDGDDRVEVELDAESLDHVIDELHDIQSGRAFEGDA